ncbi:sn-glycerol-3-phosphate ABC transporter ATP-binding protein UgpC [Paracoccus sp. Z118]|uniref:ABC transporter ATP-binding protein n=1 Tax=Paracoccus sp. Z118 TaxID=2851017 RepID=UPI001C2B8DFE|nr:sn-glycerol-3-phosphate ABC transporter ATP-binding protein UgpC [Paracoccus sp. Z118]MBV0892560.1 sn-glycerol-3-phosphate ABC transporter ATP-binding protein UgpC [Paracoccus sp. Z118]
MATVTLRRLGKSYGSVRAVKDIDCAIEDGQFVVLVGPSGCGKSTTLRMIAGLESISSGEVLIGGRVVNDLPPRERDVAMVFQDYALYPHKTVFENMAFSLRVRGARKDEIRPRVQEAAAMLGIDALLDRRPAQLSGGQRQRVAMGRAIVRRPQVFLFDEPLSNLDAKLRGQVRAEIKKLHQALGTTTVYVTHDQVEAMTMADRIVIMRDGVIEQDGTPEQVYNQPASTFVGGFIGAPAMNFLTVTLDGGAARLGPQALPLCPRNAAIAARHQGAAILGIRPEHFRPEPGPHPLAGTVQIVEPLGSDTLLHIGTEGGTVTARLPPDTRASAGQRIQLGVDIAKAHLFDAATGRVLA